MPAITPDITETNLFTVLGDFLQGVVGTAVEVVRGQVNRVPMPQGDCVVMSPGSSAALSTPTTSYTSTAKTVKQSKQWTVQIDCYGAGANDRAQVISMLLRDSYACEQFAVSGLEIQPLYAGEPKQLPLISGEQQYIERWTFDAVLQYNPRVSLPQDSATQLAIDVVNVDATYPPGA